MKMSWWAVGCQVALLISVVSHCITVVSYFTHTHTHIHTHTNSPANEKDLDRKGSILVLAVYDYDLVSANDFAGLCIVSCKEIPRLASATASLSDPNAQERKNLVLPLFHIPGSVTLNELDARKEGSDSEASDAWKVYKKFEVDKAIDTSRRGSLFNVRTLLGSLVH